MVSNVLHTPVNNIIATKNGIKPLVDMMAVLLEGEKENDRDDALKYNHSP